VLVDDELYGRFELNEPLLRDLLRTDAIGRLRGVYMGGVTSLLGIGTSSTRYEHSVGAMLLVRQLGASLEEQAAALLHDVSHTALSHVIDYVFDSPSRQAFHDDEKVRYASDTQVPAVCERHHVDWEALLDEHRWPLLEQPSPRLCADRLDYSLRDAVSLGLIPANEAAAIIAGLDVQEGRIVFANRQVARIFADLYLSCDAQCWSAPKSVVLYELTARALRRAVKIGVLERKQLWVSDQELWRKLDSSPDAELQSQMNAVLEAAASNDYSLDDGAPLASKVRTVDPDVRTENGLALLSELDPLWARKLRAYQESRGRHVAN
jgi:uncharacterized protein